MADSEAALEVQAGLPQPKGGVIQDRTLKPASWSLTVALSPQVTSFVTGKPAEQQPSSLDSFKESLAEVQVRGAWMRQG